MPKGVYDRTNIKPNSGAYKKGHVLSLEAKENKHKAMLGKQNALGYKHTKTQRRKNSEGHKGLNTWSNGRIPWNKGKTGVYSIEALRNMSKNTQGEKHPNWQGGLSFEPYTSDFNQQLKDRIRVRDNFICQLCGVPELECDRRLDIHHIDYDKNNCKENNLTSLCQKCNGKVNFNREHWTNYFQQQLITTKQEAIKWTER